MLTVSPISDRLKVVMILVFTTPPVRGDYIVSVINDPVLRGPLSFRTFTHTFRSLLSPHTTAYSIALMPPPKDFTIFPISFGSSLLWHHAITVPFSKNLFSVFFSFHIPSFSSSLLLQFIHFAPHPPPPPPPLLFTLASSSNPRNHAPPFRSTIAPSIRASLEETLASRSHFSRYCYSYTFDSLHWPLGAISLLLFHNWSIG